MRSTSQPGRRSWRTVAAAAAVGIALITAACGNVYETADNKKSGGGGSGGGSGGSGSGSSGATTGPGGGGATGAFDLAKTKQKNPSKEPGVTDDTIRIASVVAKTNILKIPADQTVFGAQAYFDMVNSQGGIWGRKLQLVSNRDDQMVKNKEEAQGVVSQDNVFAVAPVATVLFTGSQVFADAGIPTFGWNINPEWGGPPNLFGEKGSYICVTCGYASQSFVARSIGAKKIGVLAYGVEQSAECVKGVRAGVERYKTTEIAFVDDSIPFGNTDYSVQVQKMRDAGIQLIVTCMDTSGVINLAREVAKQDAKIPQYVQMGYDYDLVSTYAKEFEGSIVMTQFVPIESPDKPKGLQDYLTWIDKVPGAKRGELSVAGWLAADMLVRGLALAGPDFTRQKVVEALNGLTNWSADGFTPGWDWTVVHTADMTVACQAFSKVHDGKFEPAFAEPGKPFTCFDNNDASIPDKPRHKAGGEP